MTSVVKAVLTVALTAASFVLAAGLGARAMSMRDRVMTDDDRYYLPPSSWLRAFSIGYNEAAADLVWIKTLVYFGKSIKAVQDSEAQHTMSYLLTAVDLDPRYRSLYTAGSALALFQRSGKVSEKTVGMAIDLLERGLEIYPGDGDIAFQLGFMHYYEMRPFLPDDPSSKKARFHREEGARLIGKSALMRGAPPYAARLSASIMGKAGLEDMVVEHLKALLAQETEPEIRKLLERKLRDAIGEAAERDIRETERLTRAWQRAMPYVPYDFYLILKTGTPLEELLDPLYSFNRLLSPQ